MTTLEISQLLGDYGEFLGAIAIVVTLIYLAVQVRHSKELLERNEKLSLSQVYADRCAQRMVLSDAVIFNQSVAEAQVKFDAGGVETLDPTEKEQLAELYFSRQMYFDNLLCQQELGLLTFDDGMAGALARTIAASQRLERPYLTPRVQAWYKRNKDDSRLERILASNALPAMEHKP